MDEKKRCVELVKEMLNAYFSHQSSLGYLTAEGFATVFEINRNDEMLLQHVDVWIKIFNGAKEELEKDNGK